MICPDDTAATDHRHVDLDAIVANWRKLEKTAVPAECAGVVKANAYGCGAEQVARALANHPKLVLADEPTGNLDRRNAREALALIREICRESGAALLLVSHDDAVLQQFENVSDFSELNRAGRAAAK